MTKVKWEEMFPDELEKSFQKCPVVYFVYGLCEPHGPHNAIGLDLVKAYEIACLAAEKHGGIVAPPDPWHIHEVGGYAIWANNYVGNVNRNWLTSMPPWQHFKNVLYHLRAAEAIGFHAAILFSGHYGPNWNDLNTLIKLVQPYIGTRLYSLPEFEANYRGFTRNGEEKGDHAGRVETSLLWAVRPDLVDISRIPEDKQGHLFAMGKNAPDANRQTGERMVAEEIEWLGIKSRDLLREYDLLQPLHTFTTFDAVERIWQETVLPRFDTFETMKPIWNGQTPIPEDSPWAANMPISSRWKGS